MKTYILVCTVWTNSIIGSSSTTTIETFDDRSLLEERLKQEPYNLIGPQCRLFNGEELYYDVDVQRKQVEKKIIETVETGRTVKINRVRK